jgi:molecular chaperone GrpE
MSDQEQQQENNPHQLNEPDAVNQEVGDQAATQNVELSVEENIETLPDLTAETAEGAVVNENGNEPVIATGQASDVSVNQGDLAAILALKQENEAQKAKIEELNQQNESLKNQSIRIAADFDNFRKRTAKEKEDLEVQIKGNTITKLLPVVDNFERARSQIKPQTDGEMAIHKSYQGVYKQLVDCLKAIGVAPMRPEGSEFDPNLHEAVMREPTDEYPEGVVIEQLMRGYILGDRVLRHAMVKVAAAPESVVTSDEDNSDT